MHAPAHAGLIVARADTDTDLQRLADVRHRVDPDAQPTVENLRHHLRISPDQIYVLATLDAQPAGCGYAGSFPGSEGEAYVPADVQVVPELRGRGIGIGTELFRFVSTHVRRLGKVGLTVEAREDDAYSLDWLARRGFVEVERQKAVALDLTPAAPVDPSPPDGVGVVSRAERPDVEEAMYRVALEAGKDIPGLDGEHEPSFEQWRSFEIARPSRRPDLCFVALAGDEVVGFASLDVFGNPELAYNGLTAVARAWRGRGVATALKRAQIAAAHAAGIQRIVTESEERNIPMRALNEKLGYRPVPGMVVLQGPLAD